MHNLWKKDENIFCSSLGMCGRSPYQGSLSDVQRNARFNFNLKKGETAHPAPSTPRRPCNSKEAFGAVEFGVGERFVLGEPFHGLSHPRTRGTQRRTFRQYSS